MAACTVVASPTRPRPSPRCGRRLPLRCLPPLRAFRSTSLRGSSLSVPRWRRRHGPGTSRSCRLWLVPGLGRIRVDRLTVADVRQYLYGLPLHPQTVSHHRAVLRKALADAVTEGLLTRNVASLAKPPTVPRTERRWLSGDELRALFDATAWYSATRTVGAWLELLDYVRRNSSDSPGTTLTWTGGCSRCGTRFTVTAESGSSDRPRPDRREAFPSPATPSGRSDSTEQGNLRMRLEQGAGTPRGLVFTTDRGQPLHAAESLEVPPARPPGSRAPSRDRPRPAPFLRELPAGDRDGHPSHLRPARAQ